MPNSNDLAAVRKIRYSKDIEMGLHDTLIMNDLATDRSSEFPDGVTFQLPNLANMQVGNYSGTLSSKPVVSATSTLTMDKNPIVTYTYDDVDKLKDSWDVLARADTNSVYKLKQQMEGDFFGMLATAGNARYVSTVPTAVLSTSTAYAAVSAGVATLVHAGCNPDKIAVVLDAFTTDIISQQAISSTFSLSDDSFQRGYTKLNVAGAKLYRNQNLLTTYSFALATLPTANDTITINGVVFKFVAAIGSAAGNVLIEGTVAATQTNLLEAINATATGTPGANVGVKYVAQTADEADFLAGFVAVTGTNLFTMTSKHGFRAVSSAMTNASNDWDAVYTNAIIMEAGAPIVAYRKGIQTDKRSIPTSLEYLYSNYLLWGQTVTTEGKKRIYVLKIMAQAAEL